MKEDCDVDIIATGSELIYGQLIDTNSSWIANQLTRYGAEVRRITIVGDNINDIKEAIKRGIIEERKTIIITGGLGPSEDDLTVEAIAKTVERKVVYGRRSLKMLCERCKEFSLELNPRRKRMARIVEGAKSLENRIGLASGMMLEIEKTMIVALPGIPKELKPIFENHVLPLISKTTNWRTASIDLQIFLGEERFPILRQIQAEFPDIYIKTHSQPPRHAKDNALTEGFKVTILVKGGDADSCKLTLEKVVQRLKSLIEKKKGRFLVSRNQ